MSRQPPSRGCVLKLGSRIITLKGLVAAAFARLCVETVLILLIVPLLMQPPSRGCVLKQLYGSINRLMRIAAAFARLCVETKCKASSFLLTAAAAFARLCVETLILMLNYPLVVGSRLRAAVC